MTTFAFPSAFATASPVPVAGVALGCEGAAEVELQATIKTERGSSCRIMKILLAAGLYTAQA